MADANPNPVPRPTRGLPKRMYLKNGRYYFVQPLPDGGARWVPLSRKLDEALTAYSDITGRALGASLPPAEGAPASWIADELGSLYHRAKKGAAVRGILFTLSREDVVTIGDRSNWRCAVTGLRFSQRAIGSASMRPYAPSIDRIESAGGYTVSNCRLVCVAINLALNQWGTGVLLELARALIRAHDNNKLDASNNRPILKP